MAIRTVEEYYQSLSKLHPTAYILGEKVKNVHEHPLIKHMVAAVAKTLSKPIGYCMVVIVPDTLLVIIL